MAANLWEFFGFGPDDNSSVANDTRARRACPFVGGACTKRFQDGEATGGCTIKPTRSSPVVICPNRLYAEDYKILQDISDEVFGPGKSLVNGNQARGRAYRDDVVAVFGKGRSGELRLPRGAGGRGGYFVDWVLALLDAAGNPTEFVAVEVQTLDTTGSYRKQRDALLHGGVAPSTAGMNWENVAKRILPQLLYKGNVLRRERLSRSGLYFVCPGPVYRSFENRIGGRPQEFPPQPGSITFRWYDPGDRVQPGTLRPLVFGGQVTTTLEQIATAIGGTQGLPAPNTYEEAIRVALGQ
jgi:hypothetical protein